MARRKKRAVHWDIPRLLAVFGGIAPLLREHKKAGFQPPLTYSAVASWQARSRLPADRLAEIFVLINSSKGELNVNEFIVFEA